MEDDKKLGYDSDLILCENIPETISVTSSPEKPKQPKKKKHKRKVKRDVNYNNKLQTLLITQKVQVKKTKFKCIININTVCKERQSDSIVRFDTNVCKKDAYYHRILPICLRRTCLDDKVDMTRKCCRPALRKVYKKESPKTATLSPISSTDLTDVFGHNNISYEEVSNGNFSSNSDEELDTLIKRAKQREKQFDHLYSARSYINTSTPVSKPDDMPSPYSNDTETSLHSETTMVLDPLSCDVYEPNASLDPFGIDNFGITATNSDDPIDNMINIDDMYSPTVTPDGIRNEKFDYIPMESYEANKNNSSIESENMNCDHSTYNSNARNSPAFTPVFIKIEDLDNISKGDNTIEDYVVPYSSTMMYDVKMEDSNNTTRANINKSLNVAYSPCSPTLCPDYGLKHFNEFTNTEMSELNNIVCSSRDTPILTKNIKTENLNHESTTIGNNTSANAILISNVIKKVNENGINPTDCKASDLNVFDYNLNNTKHYKKETEVNLSRIEAYSQAGFGTIIKIEKEDESGINTHFSGS